MEVKLGGLNVVFFTNIILHLIVNLFDVIYVILIIYLIMNNNLNLIFH